jgi:hypothetical protein
MENGPWRPVRGWTSPRARRRTARADAAAQLARICGESVLSIPRAQRVWRRERGLHGSVAVLAGPLSFLSCPSSSNSSTVSGSPLVASTPLAERPAGFR